MVRNTASSKRLTPHLLMVYTTWLGTSGNGPETFTKACIIASYAAAPRIRTIWICGFGSGTMPRQLMSAPVLGFDVRGRSICQIDHVDRYTSIQVYLLPDLTYMGTCLPVYL